MNEFAQKLDESGHISIREILALGVKFRKNDSKAFSKRRTTLGMGSAVFLQPAKRRVAQTRIQ